MELPTLQDLKEAATVVYRFMSPTAQYNWPLLSRQGGCELWAKHENHTPVGSFKVRGSLVYLDWLRKTHPETRGVISATRGNHGQSLAFAAQRFGLEAVVVVPFGNSREKNEAMRGLGAEVVEYGEDFHEADHHADTLARDRGLHRVSSFNRLLVSGAGTWALELFTAVSELDVVYVPIGLGSGACGVAGARNALGLRTQIVGVVSAAAPCYARSFGAGRVIECRAQTRIADGMAISRPREEALDLLRRELTRIVEVDDAGVEEAMRACFSATHNVVEGAGAAALAAVFLEGAVLAGRRVGVVFTGANVDREVFSRILRA